MKTLGRLLVLTLAGLVAGCSGSGDSADSKASDPQRLPSSAPTSTPAEPVTAAQRSAALAQLGYAVGTAGAPVEVVEFSDFGCGYCARFARESYPELQRDFVAKGQVHWIYIPFSLGMFPNGAEAARTGICAGDQDRFWQMHDLLFERQREWKGSDTPVSLFRGYARQVGLDEVKFATCYEDPQTAAKVERNSELAGQLGVRATPTFFFNGRMVEGALPMDQFRMLLGWSGAAGSTGAATQ